MQKAIQALRLV